MSTKHKQLTTLQEQIIDALANNYEDVEQLRGMLDQPTPDEELQSALWALLKEGYVACDHPTEMKPVAHPDCQQLDN